MAVAEFMGPAARRLPWLPEMPRDARQPSFLSLFVPHSTNFMVLQHTSNGYTANTVSQLWFLLLTISKL